MRLFLKEFLFLVVISNVIALPIAYWGIHQWLESFAYRTQAEITIFAGTGFVNPVHYWDHRRISHLEKCAQKSRLTRCVMSEWSDKNFEAHFHPPVQPVKIMRDVHPNTRVILIGGSSHSGKSALSESIAANLGWNRISTDTLARHPGRPWRPEPGQVPDHVAEHYLSLSVDQLIKDVLHHYRVNVWPKVEKIVASHINDPSRGRLIIEGSALWPELVATLDSTLLLHCGSQRVRRFFGRGFAMKACIIRSRFGNEE